MCRFNRDNPISRSPDGGLHRRSVGGSEKSRFVCDKSRMQTLRWTELLQMLEVTTTGSHSHVDSQALGEVHHRLVTVFLWQLFPDGLQGGFQPGQSY